MIRRLARKWLARIILFTPIGGIEWVTTLHCWLIANHPWMFYTKNERRVVKERVEAMKALHIKDLMT